MIIVEFINVGAEKDWIFAIFSLQKAKIAFESFEFSKCFGNVNLSRS